MTQNQPQKLKSSYKPVVLIVLDGFGVNVNMPETTWNYAKRPTFEDLEKFWPFTTLQASGIAVGIPWNEPGNSEIGHLTMGAGRVLYHHLPRIISSIDDGSFFENEALVSAANKAKETGGKLHLMGLFSSGSVHAYIEHLYALLEFAKKAQVPETFIHIFADGKDAPPDELGSGFLERFMEQLKEYPNIKIGSIVGRHYSMDRDENWDRIEVAYRLLTEARGEPFSDPQDYIKKSYAAGKNDTFISPGFLTDESGAPAGRIKDGDAVVFWNFREDSERELTNAFVDERFDRFERKRLDILFVTMTEYEKRLVGTVKVAFPSLDIKWPLAHVISDAGLKQLHIAEVEKYAHVTYFFNGGKEKPFPGEERVLIPSAVVKSFDERPEMSAHEVADAVIKNLGKYDFILANFANGDMVGHTGNFEATVKAIEVLDFSIGKIIPKVLEAGGIMIITADHGNAEEKRYRATGEKRTHHTINPVPCYFVAEELRQSAGKSTEEVREQYRDVKGVLTDIAPTVLQLMGLKKPAEMTGESLLDKLE